MKSLADFGIEYEGIFEGLNVDYIENRFQEFNQEYFGGQLNIPRSIIAVYTAGGKAAGSVISTHDFSTGGTKILSFNIGNKNLNKKAKAPEKIWCEIILHEMIHVYQIQVLKTNWKKMASYSYAHGDTFLTKMNELNKKGGWNITTVYDNDTFIITDDYANRIKGNFYFWTVPYNNNYIVGLTREKDAPLLKSKSKNIQFYKVLDSSQMWSLKVSKSKVSGPLWVKDKIDDLLDTGKITSIGDVDTIDIATEIAQKCYLSAYESSFTPGVFCNIFNKKKLRDITDTFQEEFGKVASRTRRVYKLKIYEIYNGEQFKRWRIIRGVSFRAGYKMTNMEINSLIDGGMIKQIKDIEINGNSNDSSLKESLSSSMEKRFTAPDNENDGFFYWGQDENGNKCLCQSLS